MTEVQGSQQGLEIRFKIFEAFYNLMQPATASVDSISVKQICLAAGVSRPTFYYYFTDKYDLVFWFMKTIGDSSIGEAGQTFGIRESVYNWIVAVERYQNFFCKCLKSKYFDQCEPIVMPIMRNSLTRAATAQRGRELSPQLCFDIRYYCSMLATAVTDLICGKTNYTEEELADYLIGSMPRELYALLEKPSQGDNTFRFIATMQCCG